MDVNEMIELRLVHEVHTSERKSYRACRRRWNWIFRNNLYPSITAKPLEFGVAFHVAMETYYDPDTWNWPRETVAQYAIKKFVDTAERQRKAALRALDQQYLDEAIQEDYNERVELGRGMLRHFFTNISPREDRGWTPLKVEVAFLVPVPHPDTGGAILCKCRECRKRWAAYFRIPARAANRTPEHKRFIRQNWKGLPVVFAGRCDAIFRDANGNLLVADWKTAAQMRDDDEFLELDDQVGGYVYALRKLGVDVRGFVYYEIRKGFPKVPERNKVMRLGRMYSVNKMQETDYDTYLQTVSEEDKEAYEGGLYDNFLAFLENEGVKYYRRRLLFKTDHELSQFEYNLGQEILEMIDPNLRIYPSPGRFGCTTCAFRIPCIEKNAGGDYQYALDTMYDKRQHYYVRQEPSTESKGAE